MSADVDITALSDRAAIVALKEVANTWLVARGIEASQALVAAAIRQGSSFQDLPEWIVDPGKSEGDAGRVARLALQVMVDGSDDEVVSWVSDSANETSTAAAHIIDPVTLGIVG